VSKWRIFGQLKEQIWVGVGGRLSCMAMATPTTVATDSLLGSSRSRLSDEHTKPRVQRKDKHSKSRPSPSLKQGMGGPPSQASIQSNIIDAAAVLAAVAAAPPSGRLPFAEHRRSFLTNARITWTADASLPLPFFLRDRPSKPSCSAGICAPWLQCLGSFWYELSLLVLSLSNTEQEQH